MAQRVEVNKPRGASEDEAQRLLARVLPRSWIITTNIKEHMFAGPRKPEIDSLLLTPAGLFILDFKNFRGVVTPMLNASWNGPKGTETNPLEQASDNIYPVKDLLGRYDEQLKNIWIESLIVLTNADVEVNWRASDVTADARMHISLLGEVESKVRQIAASKRMSLDSNLASKILAALKPIAIPPNLFSGPDWVDGSASGRNLEDKSVVVVDEQKSQDRPFANNDERTKAQEELKRKLCKLDGTGINPARMVREINEVSSPAAARKIAENIELLSKVRSPLRSPRTPPWARATSSAESNPFTKEKPEAVGYLGTIGNAGTDRHDQRRTIIERGDIRKPVRERFYLREYYDGEQPSSPVSRLIWCIFILLFVALLSWFLYSHGPLTQSGLLPSFARLFTVVVLLVLAVVGVAGVVGNLYDVIRSMFHRA